MHDVFVSISVAHTLLCVHTERMLVNLQIREYILLKLSEVVSQSLFKFFENGLELITKIITKMTIYC